MSRVNQELDTIDQNPQTSGEENTTDGPESFSGYNGLSIHPLDLPDEHKLVVRQ